jgi:hypothetical protein
MGGFDERKEVCAHDVSEHKTFGTVAQATAMADLPVKIGDRFRLDVIERWVNCVSAAPSGGSLQSNPVVQGSGLPLKPRARMFSLEEGLPTSLAPFHPLRTKLTPSMAEQKDDRRVGQAYALGQEREEPLTHSIFTCKDAGGDTRSRQAAGLCLHRDRNHGTLGQTADDPADPCANLQPLPDAFHLCHSFAAQTHAIKKNSSGLMNHTPMNDVITQMDAERAAEGQPSRACAAATTTLSRSAQA